ncbi:MAG: hypothetical protein R3A13_04755 [Bdellovibrionota bacterium]
MFELRLVIENKYMIPISLPKNVLVVDDDADTRNIVSAAILRE